METEYKTNITTALGDNKDKELISNEDYVRKEVEKNHKKYENNHQT